MKFKLLFILFSLLAIINESQAQQQKSLTIKFHDGTENGVLTSSLQKITFSGNNLVLNNTDGTITSFAISTINKMYFTGLSAIETVPYDKNSVYVYPNPSSNFIFIKNLPDEETVISIFRIDGTLAMKTIVGSENRQIDVSGLSSGMYIIKTDSKALNFRRK